jgi:nickel-dependent lactate racemase
MPPHTIPYGHSKIDLTLPASLHPTLIAPKQVAAAPDPQEEVNRALKQLLGDVSWADFAQARRVAIVISDKTRPVPNHLLLPPLLKQVHALGITADSIMVLIGAGCHPPLTPAEYPQVLPPALLARYRVFSHDCDDSDVLVYQRETPAGTPVWVNRHFAEADLRIVVGNIEPHQFQGYSGGAKGAAIGVAGRATINANHSLMTHSQAQLGRFEDNPARQDVESIGQAIDIHLAVNVILNQDKQILKALAGTPLAVMRAGISLVQDICQVSVPQLQDVVIASPGGHPKDINLYQTQKSLAHATLITRPGGFVILAAACPEGPGDDDFSLWMEQRRSLDDVLETFRREGFQVGPHKAFLLARDATRVQVRLVSEMRPESVRRLWLIPSASVEVALEEAMASLPTPLRVGIMPLANTTIPVVARRG